MKKAYIKYLTSMLLFGINGIIASNIDLTSYAIVLFRTFLGSLFLLCIFFTARKHFTFAKHPKDLIFIGVSGVSMGLSWMFLYEAYSKLGVGIASLLYYCGPVIVMIISPFLFKERLTLPKVLGFAVVLCGIFLINGRSSGPLNVWGVACGLLSAVTYSVMVSSNKLSKNISGMENSLIQLIFAFITVGIFNVLKSGLYLPIKNEDIPWILVLGVVNTGIGCYLYFTSIGSLPVQTVAICGYLEALCAVIFSAIFLAERMQPLQILGGALIIGGALFGENFKKRRKT